MIAWLEEHGHGNGTVQYKLRDWLFSRQRYWGEPFPVVYDEEGTPVAVPESMLPVELPEVADYSPKTFDPMDADTEPSPRTAPRSPRSPTSNGRRARRRPASSSAPMPSIR